MAIPTYQIHNVLKVFSRHLVNRENSVSGGELLTDLPLIQQLPISEGKRAAVVERVAADILKKLSCYGTPTESTGGEAAAPQKRLRNDSRRFVYNCIGEDLRKTVHTINDDSLKGLGDPEKSPSG